MAMLSYGWLAVLQQLFACRLFSSFYHAPFIQECPWSGEAISMLRSAFEVPGDTRMVEESHNALRLMTCMGSNNVSSRTKRQLKIQKPDLEGRQVGKEDRMQIGWAV
jgi:hypothetical protein